MKGSCLVLATLGLLSCAGRGMCQAPAQAGDKKGGPPFGKFAMPRWEYRVISNNEVALLANGAIGDGLNKLGDEGWELVSIVEIVRPPAQTFYFKRPLRPQMPPPPAKDPPKDKAKDANAGTFDRIEYVTQIIKLREAKAVETTNMMLELFGKKNVRIVADPRTNSLVVMAPAGVMREIEAVMRRLDE